MSVPTKIIMELDDDLNLELRRYIFEKYPTSQYGRLKEVIQEALKEFMKNHPISEQNREVRS